MNGFQNIGNSCYLNASLQIFKQIKYIINYEYNINDNNIDLSNPILNILFELINDYSEKSYVKLYKLICKNLNYNYYSQEDSCEVIQYILDLLNNVLKNYIHNIFSTSTQNILICNECNHIKICDIQKESIFISKTLLDLETDYTDITTFIRNGLKKESIFDYKLDCECKKSNKQISSNNNNNIINNEQHTDNVVNDQSKEQSEVRLQNVLTDLPYILVIKVFRCLNNNKKVTKLLILEDAITISTPEDLAGRCNNTNFNNINHSYKLSGIIIHIGSSPNNGHYYSYINNNNIWYYCNDDFISELPKFNLNSKDILENSCVLLYKKIIIS